MDTIDVVFSQKSQMAIVFSIPYPPYTQPKEVKWKKKQKVKYRMKHTFMSKEGKKLKVAILKWVKNKKKADPTEIFFESKGISQYGPSLCEELHIGLL